MTLIVSLLSVCQLKNKTANYTSSHKMRLRFGFGRGLEAKATASCRADGETAEDLSQKQTAPAAEPSVAEDQGV